MATPCLTSKATRKKKKSSPLKSVNSAPNSLNSCFASAGIYKPTNNRDTRQLCVQLLAHELVPKVLTVCVMDNVSLTRLHHR